MLANTQMIVRKLLIHNNKSKGSQRFRFERHKETLAVHMYDKCFTICFTVIYLIFLLTWVPNVNQPLHCNT